MATYPRAFEVLPRPLPIDEPWPEPPAIKDPNRMVASRFADPAPPIVYDLALFESLNEEYANDPVVPVPRSNDARGMTDRAVARLERVHQEIDLRDKRVLEFGCGGGYEVWLMSHQLGADATGVDVVSRGSWASLEDERTHFVMADLSVDRPFPANHFDRVISFSVLEHVTHPHANVSALFRAMRPGGLAFISANLFRGPMASHRYREVYFPFPHILFEESVFEQYYARHGLPPDGRPAWVNRLSWADYESMFLRIGFVIRALRFSKRALDEAFYERFETELGRYPRWDLERDFFHVVLEKPARRPAPRGR